MNITPIVIFFTVLATLTVLSHPLSKWTRLPPAALQVLLGMAAAYLATQGLGLDTGLRAHNFHDLVFFVFLPIVLFHAAYELRLSNLLKDLTGILSLALLGLILTTMLCALFLYHGIGHPRGFPWTAALLAGALLSATDPAAVTQMLRDRGVSGRLLRLLDGESLFNDALAIVLFSAALALALMPEVSQDARHLFSAFGVNVIGGVGVGALGGALARPLLLRLRDTSVRTATGLAVAYGTYLLAELSLNASGAMAALAAGLILGRADRSVERSAGEFWALLNYLANGALFLLMGATITLAMFEQRWLAMLIAIGAALVARLLVVGATFAVLRPLSAAPLTMAQQAILVWGGTRGAVTLALALSLPTSLDYWWTIQSMAFGVVIFGLLVQAPTLPLLLNRDHAPEIREGADDD